MINEDRFEQHLAEWLEEGPFVAPDRAVSAAVAHAQTHPRSRLGLRRLARAVAIRVGLTGADPWSGGSRLTAFGVPSVAVVVVAVIAVGGLVILGTSLNRTAVGPAGPTAAPTATPIPTPPASVVATSVCRQVDPGTTSTAASAGGDVTQRREVGFRCTFASADPRLQGNATYTLNADERADGSADIWGSVTIANDEGGWDGYWIGTVDAGGLIDRIEAAYQGTGIHEGLRLATSQVSEGLGGTIDGTIERADSVPAASESVITGATCRALNGPVTSEEVGSVTQERGATVTCRVRSTDPRLASDNERVVVNGDSLADGSATIWGTATLANVGGTWQATWDGTIETGYTTHRMTGVSVGSGGYAGLEYHFSQIGTNNGLVVRIGNVVPTP